MIANWLKNALIALLLNGGAAYAFHNDEAPAADLAAPAQSCAVPVQLSADSSAQQANDSYNNGAQS